MEGNISGGSVLTVAAFGRPIVCKDATNENQQNEEDEHQPNRGRRGVVLCHPRSVGSLLPSCVSILLGLATWLTVCAKWVLDSSTYI